MFVLNGDGTLDCEGSIAGKYQLDGEVADAVKCYE